RSSRCRPSRTRTAICRRNVFGVAARWLSNLTPIDRNGGRSCSATIGPVNPALHAALAEGAVVVTPNRRLARFLHREFDVAQRADGRIAWPTPTILPYPNWLQMLWSEAVLADAMTDAALLLTSSQSLMLWRRIVKADGLS